MTVKDLITNKDYDYISWRIAVPEHLQEKFNDTTLFIGAAASKDGKLISLDGDSYSEDEVVLSYKEWTEVADDHVIPRGLTVVVDAEWDWEGLVK